ncbi:hypothetical protein TNCV_1976251 [Trichonephila clavipes]|nr:hypothetical protein TNCV_1976251 [Trichonephila clavipes]
MGCYANPNPWDVPYLPLRTVVFLVASQFAIVTLFSLRNSDSNEGGGGKKKKFMNSAVLTGLLPFNGSLAIAPSWAKKCWTF